MKYPFVVKAHEMADYQKSVREHQLDNLSKEKLIREIQDLKNRLSDFKGSKRRANMPSLSPYVLYYIS